jgi:hypothetical protein
MTVAVPPNKILELGDGDGAALSPETWASFLEDQEIRLVPARSGQWNLNS